MAATPEGARTFLLGSGAIYVVLFLIGIIGAGDWVPTMVTTGCTLVWPSACSR